MEHFEVLVRTNILYRHTQTVSLRLPLLLDSLSLHCSEIDSSLWCIIVVSANQITAVHERNPLGSPKETADLFSLYLFSEPDTNGGVKSEKWKNMAECLTGLLCCAKLHFYFPVLEKKKKGISFVSFCFAVMPLLTAQSPFVTTRACLKCILQNFLWVDSLYPFRFVLSHPTIGLTNGDTSKASSKWHDRFSTSFHHNKAAMIPLSLFTFVVAQSVLWSR